MLQADLSKEDEIDNLWRKIIDISPGHKVDILVNNAARVLGKKLKDMEVREFRESISVNLLAYVHLAKLFLDQKNNNN